jgi:hypothetical protein
LSYCRDRNENKTIKQRLRLFILHSAIVRFGALIKKYKQTFNKIFILVVDIIKILLISDSDRGNGKKR